MKHLVLATAGHIDHGKTALIRALTGIETDTLEEEKRRGITINLGYAYLALSDGQVLGVVDVPGHERFVRTMLAGVGGVDMVLLVVAADDGIMPQTREHLEIVNLLAVRCGIVALSKCDLVDDHRIAQLRNEIRNLLAPTLLADSPIVAVSAVTGRGLGELKTTIERVAANCPPRPQLPLTRLPIDRVFTKSGFGTIVTGTLFSGSIDVSAELVLLPAGLTVRVRGLQAYRQSVSHVYAGQRVAVNLASINRELVSRGDVLAQPGAFEPTQLFDATVYVVADARAGLRHGLPVRVHLASSEVPARVALLDAEHLRPGQRGLVQLRLAGPLVCRRGDRYVIRSSAGDFTIGGGQVLDAHPLVHRRRRFDAAAQLARLADADDRKLLAYELEKHLQGCSFEVLAERLSWTGRHLQDALDRAIESGAAFVAGSGAARIFFSRKLFEQIADAAAEALQAFHAEKPMLTSGLPAVELITRLRSARPVLAKVPEQIFLAVFGQMARLGRLRWSGRSYAMATHRPRFEPHQAELAERIRRAYLAEPFSPAQFPQWDFAKDAHPEQLREVHDALLDSGELLQAGGICFHRGAVEQAEQLVRQFLRRHGAATMSQLRQLLNTSRKYAIPLMTLLDELGVTIREGDVRRLRSEGDSARDGSDD